MMCRAILAYEAASIQTEDDRESLKGYVMHDLVIGSL
jgi:hypothetical protein